MIATNAAPALPATRRPGRPAAFAMIAPPYFQIPAGPDGGMEAKAPHLAIDAARAAGQPIVLAGNCSEPSAAPTLR